MKSKFDGSNFRGISIATGLTDYVVPWTTKDEFEDCCYSVSTGINADFGASSDAHISLNLPNLPVDSDPELAETAAAAKYLYR